MTTQVIILCPVENHHEITVSVGGTHKVHLKQGQSTVQYVHGSQSLLIEEVLKEHASTK
jgi:hypothetical protein